MRKKRRVSKKEPNVRDAQLINIGGESCLLLKVKPEIGTRVSASFTSKGLKVSFNRSVRLKAPYLGKKRKSQVKHVD